MKHVIALIILTSASAIALAQSSNDGKAASALTATANKAKAELVTKANAITAQFDAAKWAAFAAKADDALNALEADGRSVEAQRRAIEVLLPWAAELRGTVGEFKSSNIVEVKDRVVAVYAAIADDQEAQAKRYVERARASGEGEFRTHYEQLAATCTRMGRAYRLEGAHYAKLDVSAQLRWSVQAHEYLGEVTDVLQRLHTALGQLQDDQGILQQLKGVHLSVKELQAAITKISTIVEQAAFERESSPSPAGTPPQK